MHRLLQVWDIGRFTVHKIKSHLELAAAATPQELWHIHGNACADEAAGKSRQTDDADFSALCQQVRAHRLQQQANLTRVFHYLLDLPVDVRISSRPNLIFLRVPRPPRPRALPLPPSITHVIHYELGHLKSPSLRIPLNRIVLYSGAAPGG